MKSEKFIIKSLALIIGSSAMTLSGQNWHIGIFAWIAPVCLLFYTRNTKKTGFAFFFIFMLLVGYFSQTCQNVFNIFVVGIINALGYAILSTLIYYVTKLLYTTGKGFYSTLIFPSVIAVTEFLGSSQMGTFGIVAHTQYSFNLLIQFSSIAGIFGITFIVAWFGSVVNWIFENNFSKSSIYRSTLIFGSIFLSVIIYGKTKVFMFSHVEKTVKVATISGTTNLNAIVAKEQDNFIELTKNPELPIPERIFSDKDAVNAQIANTIEAAKEGAKIIVWSEDALILNPRQVDSLFVKAKDISKTYNAYLLIAFLEKDNSNRPKPFNNTSILITPKGEIAWRYFKLHLHPYAEAPIINPGKAIIPYYDTEYGRIGNVICYDMDFPTFLQQTGKNSIDIMLVPSYDWEKITLLHSNMACFEAIQNGFSLIRANGVGINSIRDNQGNVIAEMNTLTSDSRILIGELPLKRVTTLYAKIGNVAVYLMMLFLLLIIGLRIAKRGKMFGA